MTVNWLDLNPYHRAYLSRWRCSQAADSLPLFPNMLIRSEVYPDSKMTVSKFSNMISHLRNVPWQKKTDSVSTLYKMHPCRSHCIMTENWRNFYILQLASPLLCVLWQKTGSVSTLYNVLPSVKCSVTENRSSFYIFQCASPLFSAQWQ